MKKLLLAVAPVIVLSLPIAYHETPQVVEINDVCAQSADWHLISYDLATLVHRYQVPLRDDGHVTVEIHAINGRYGTSGKWIRAEGSHNGQSYVVSGGENHIRLYSAGLRADGVMFDYIRLMHDGWHSNVSPVSDAVCVA